MTSGNEVSLLMRVSKLRILPLFNLYTNAKLPYWSILSYHNKCTVVITKMGRFVYPFWKKRMIAIWSSAVDSVFFCGSSLVFFLEVAHSVTVCYEQIDRRRNLCLVLSGPIETWSMICVQHLACCTRIIDQVSIGPDNTRQRFLRRSICS